MNTQKPVILITHKSDPDGAYFGVGRIHRLRSNYCRAIVNAGGVPIISALGDAEVYAEIADGVVFSGGGMDIDPTRYRDKHRKAAAIDFEIDDMELKIFEAFYKKQKPMLGICRGIQLINVALGGNLIQDLSEEVPGLTVHKEIFEADKRFHPVTATEGSVFHRLFGESFLTNSHHHQAVKECGAGLIPSVVTEEGAIEAIEHASLPIFAVQWHPERQIGEEYLNLTNMMPLFHHFVDCCKKR